MGALYPGVATHGPAGLWPVGISLPPGWGGKAGICQPPHTTGQKVYDLRMGDKKTPFADSEAQP